MPNIAWDMFIQKKKRSYPKFKFTFYMLLVNLATL